MHFHLAKTLHTPEVQVNLERGVMLLRGACFPENSAEFFSPIHKFLQENRQVIQGKQIALHLELTYLNSSAKKELWELLDFISHNICPVHLVLYRGLEEEELEDYSDLMYVWSENPSLSIEARDGYYET
jgi:hypothetical protein